MAKLVMKTGRDAGKSYALSKSAILGRGDTVQIRVLDVKASREHCRVFEQNGEWVVVDLNSRNGITVNDMKKTRHPLREGDEIAIGETVIVFHAGPGEAEAEPRQKSERQAPPAVSDAAKKAKAEREKAFAAARAESKGGKGAKAGRSAPGAAGANADGSIQVSDRVLQYNKSEGGGVFGIDLGQMTVFTQVLIGLGTIALLVGLWFVFSKVFAE